MSDDEIVIVCAPVEGRRNGRVVAGSISANCVECTRAAWVSPSSFELLAKGADVLCYSCLKRRLDENPDEPLEIIRHPNYVEQEDELREVWRRRPRGHWR